MHFKEELAQFKLNFDNKIESYLKSQKLLSQNYNPTFVKNLSHVSHLVLTGGKRFRPAMAYFGYKLVQENNEVEDVWTIGIALELFHCFALIHDDIIDKSFVRRGEPTLEAVYRDFFKQTKPSIDANHFAMSAAILGGDVALILANKIIGELHTSDSKSNLLLKQYYNMQFELAAGQIDDCFGVGLTDFDMLEESKILAMIKNKSGNYSIQQPLLMGAILAGASQNQLDSLSQIGEDLGLVFQIQDDILGLFGDEKDLGKSNKIDVYEGKRTLLMYHTYQKASSQDKQTLLSILGNEQASDEQVEAVKTLVKSTGTLQEMSEYCHSLISRAKSKLTQDFGEENHAVGFLCDLADYLYTRKS